MSDFTYLCSECGYCFSSDTSLQEHHLAVHCSQKHVCFMCHKVFTGALLLECHVTAHQKLLHCCNICGELCENKVDIYVHVTTSHKYGGKIVCDLCSKIFPSTFDLKVHSINRHADEMPQALQKWELFCNIHSSRNLCELDALKDSFNLTDAYPLHTSEKKGSNESDLSILPTSKRSILLPETADDSEWERGYSDSSLTELQIFLHEQDEKESGHLDCSIQPNVSLERSQYLTAYKNRLEKDQPTESSSYCDISFSDRKDYMLAHDGKDPSNAHQQNAQKQEEKSISKTGIQDSVELRKSIVFSMDNTERKCDCPESVLTELQSEKESRDELNLPAVSTSIAISLSETNDAECQNDCLESALTELQIDIKSKEESNPSVVSISKQSISLSDAMDNVESNCQESALSELQIGKKSREECNPSIVSKSNQSILLSETRRDCPEGALSELQIFLREQGDKESWCTKNTDHLDCSIQPNDILERVQSLTANKNSLQEDQLNPCCGFCDTTFSDRNDYLLAHDSKTPSNVFLRMQEEPSSQTRIQDVIKLRQTIVNSIYRPPMND